MTPVTGFSYFQSSPDGLGPLQSEEWNSRRQTAENILDQLPDAVPDAETILHLQRYVEGDITLGQAIGRLLDQQARTR